MSTNGKPDSRNAAGQFVPGQSGNPGGRAKGISKQAQELAGGNPDKLLIVLLNIAQDVGAKDSDRIAASREYLDRGWGKAPAFAPIEGQDPLELTDIDRSIATIVDDLARRRQEKTACQPANGKVAEGNPGAEG